MPSNPGRVGTNSGGRCESKGFCCRIEEVGDDGRAITSSEQIDVDHPLVV